MTRKSLVLAVANQDGGAHVSGTLKADYAAIKVGAGLVVVFGCDGGTAPTTNGQQGARDSKLSTTMITRPRAQRCDLQPFRSGRRGRLHSWHASTTLLALSSWGGDRRELEPVQSGSIRHRRAVGAREHSLVLHRGGRSSASRIPKRNRVLNRQGFRRPAFHFRRQAPMIIIYLVF